jgi:hypothetical protein
MERIAAAVVLLIAAGALYPSCQSWGANAAEPPPLPIAPAPVVAPNTIDALIQEADAPPPLKHPLPIAPPPDPFAAPQVPEEDHSAMANHLRGALAARKVLMGSHAPNAASPAGANSAEEIAGNQRVAGMAMAEYLAALQTADFTTDVPRYFIAPASEGTPWDVVAQMAHEERKLHAALVERFLQCPPHKATLQAGLLVSNSLDDCSWTAHADLARQLALALLEQQPHLLYQMPWVGLVHVLDAPGMKEDAATLAQALALVVPPDDYTPPEIIPGLPFIVASPQSLNLPVESDHLLLRCGLRKKTDAFLERLHDTARQRPQDHGRASLWLEGKALQGLLTRADLDVAKNWGPFEKITRAAGILCMVDTSRIVDVFDPWTQEALHHLFASPIHDDEVFPPDTVMDVILKDGPLLQSPAMSTFVRDRLPQWIDGTKPVDERSYEPVYYGFLSCLASRFGSEAQQETVLRKWLQQYELCTRNDDSSVLEAHAAMMAEAAMSAPPRMAARMTAQAADLLMGLCRASERTDYQPDIELTRMVLRALLVTCQHDRLAWACSEVERRTLATPENQRRNPGMLAVLVELRSLQGVLLHRPDHLPRAIAWTRGGETPGAPPTIAWEYTAPLRPPSGFNPAHINDSGVNEVAWIESNQGGGLRSPLLEMLSGCFDLTLEMGPAPDRCQPVAEVPHAGAHGVVTLSAAPPPCGYLRTVVRDRATGRQLASTPRPYSLEPPVIATGTEPTDACGAAFTAPASAAHGATTMEWLPIDPDQTYLLTTWIPLPVQADGSMGLEAYDGDGALCFVDEKPGAQCTTDIQFHLWGSTNGVNPCFQSQLLSPTQLQIGDRPAPHKKESHHPSAELGEKAPPKRLRYVTFTRHTATGPSPALLFQLRPFHVPGVK